MPDRNDLNKLVKDSAYAAVGFGVLGFQKAQVRRRELIEQLSNQGGQAAQLGRHIDSLTDQIESHLSQIGGQIGSQLGTLRSGASAGAAPLGAVRSQIGEVAKIVDRQVQPVRQQIDNRLSEVEDLLPPPTRGVVKSIRNVAQTQEAAIRTAIGLDA